MSLITSLVFVSLVLSEWNHFDVAHFRKDFCELNTYIYPRWESRLHCYDVIFTANQRFDIQSKQFTISNSNHIVFFNSRIDPLNDMFFDKFPEAWLMELSNSTLVFSSDNSNLTNLSLETLVIKESYIVNQENSKPFTNLINLKKLLITSSNFSDPILDKNLLKFTTNLTSIYIVSSNLKAIESGAFDNLPKLKDLSITRSPLYELPGDIFLNNRALLRLDFSNDLFDEIPDVVFPKSVEELKMSFNYLEHLERKHFRHLMGLKGLHLYGNFIKDFFIDTFWDLDSLEDLVLTKNNIHNISWKHFIFCGQLEWLDLQDNFLKEDSMLGSRIPNILISSQKESVKVERVQSKSFYEDFWLLFV